MKIRYENSFKENFILFFLRLRLPFELNKLFNNNDNDNCYRGREITLNKIFLVFIKNRDEKKKDERSLVDIFIPLSQVEKRRKIF